MLYNHVALVSLPRQDLLRPPAALPVLAGICEQANVDYSVWDFNLWLRKNCDDDLWQFIDSNWIKVNSMAATNEPQFQTFKTLLDKYVDLILSVNPNLIAISVFTHWSAHCAREMVSAIRKKSNVEIVLGGTGITTKLPTHPNIPMCQMLLDQQQIDYYVYGEGEINFLNLLQGKVNFVGINNLEQEQIEDLNTLGLPSYTKINPSDYFYVGEPSLTVNGSRGCVRACTYCDVAHYWPKFRYKDGDKIADELFHTWQSTGVKSFEFSDSLINGSIREFKKLNQRLINLQKQVPEFKINYKGQFICRSANQFKEQDYKDMVDAGCDYLYVGVETFSESVRMSMDKKFDNDALDFHLQMCGKYGIPNVFLMIVGYPTETIEDHQINLAMLKKYQKYAHAGIIKMITFGFTTSILEHTPLHRQREMLNIVDEFEDYKSFSNWVSLDNPSLTFRERVRRWIELTETAMNLGYLQPRIDAIVSRLRQELELTKTKSLKYRIKHV